MVKFLQDLYYARYFIKYAPCIIIEGNPVLYSGIFCTLSRGVFTKGVYTSEAGGPEGSGHIFRENTKIPKIPTSKGPESWISDSESDPKPGPYSDISDNVDCESCLEIKIEEIMAREVVTVREDTPLKEIFGLFEKYRFHTFPVLDSEGKLVGIIDQDIILEILLFAQVPRAKHTHLMAVRSLGVEAGDIMITHPVTVSHDSTIRHTADLMMKHRFDRVCVVEAGKLVGVISKRDIVTEVSRGRKK